MGYDPYNQQGQSGQHGGPFGQSQGSPHYAPAYGSGQPESGHGEASPLPPELEGWNWGAFLLNWIWGLGNNVMIALLSLIVPFFPIYLGLKGNELAWQNKHWDSIEHFRETQAKWSKWGIIIAIVWTVLVAICVCLYIGVFAAILGSSST